MKNRLVIKRERLNKKNLDTLVEFVLNGVRVKAEGYDNIKKQLIVPIDQFKEEDFWKDSGGNEKAIERER